MVSVLKMNNRQKRKRIRSSNFSYKETDVLLQLVDQFRGVIENKKTDYDTNSQKEAVWEQLAINFNNITETMRTKDSLRSKWDSLKKNARKKYADLKANPARTEVDSYNTMTLLTTFEDRVFERVLDIIKVSATGTHGRFDCDSEGIEVEHVQGTETGQLHQEQIIKQEESCSSSGSELQHHIVAEWSEWHPKLLEQPVHPALNSGAALVIDPLQTHSQNVKNSRQKITRCRPKKNSEKKAILTTLAEKRIGLVELQVQLLKEEHAKKMKFMEEKHQIEIELLRTELQIKKESLTKLQN